MKAFIATVTPVLCLLGCGASQPPPTQQMADVQSADRGAVELGAQNNPRAQLHLKLAEEQLAMAKKAVEKDDNERAAGLLTRAKADAELAIALTREDDAKSKAQQAVDQSNVQRNKTMQMQQGAAQ